ncbi:MAG: hypothetical protein EHM40_13445 [Chloroflexi bacterium]|nr:MAG: hypothetical protein EHM40_13445 [Chloroflexota bacterium]
METGTLIFLLFIVGIIPFVLILRHWRKAVNPVIQVTYELATVIRKREYLPPKIFIEGYGIRRGLSTYEAALISERPFREVLGMMLADAMEKGAVRVASLDPLKLESDKLLPDSLSRDERDFVRICSERNVKKRQERFANLLIKMIRTISNGMRGFSHKETVNYYMVIVEAASQKANHENIRSIIYRLIDDMDELTRKITKATNPYRDAPIFKEQPEFMRRRMSRRGPGGGSAHGGGGGCACACAGCACACAGCACACAGGGR